MAKAIIKNKRAQIVFSLPTTTPVVLTGIKGKVRDTIRICGKIKVKCP